MGGWAGANLDDCAACGAKLEAIAVPASAGTARACVFSRAASFNWPRAGAKWAQDITGVAVNPKGLLLQATPLVAHGAIHGNSPLCEVGFSQLPPQRLPGAG